MVYSKLLISILAVLAVRCTLAETDKDDAAPVKTLREEARVKRSSDGEFLNRDEMRPRKQKKIAPLDGEDSSESIPVRKANERQHSSGNHTKKIRAKEPDDSADVKETRSSNSKIIESSSSTEKLETSENSEKKSESTKFSAGKSASVIATKDELPIKEKKVKTPDLAAEVPVVPVAPASPPSNPVVEQIPAANVIPQTDPQTSQQAPADGSDSFAIFYYFSGVLFLVLASLAWFLYKFLFKPPTPPQSARAAGTASSYAKVPQSDLEMSLSSASRAAAGKEESDWEEWDGEEKIDSAPPPHPHPPLPTISSQTSNISSDSDDEQEETLPQLGGSRASPNSSGGAVSGGSGSGSSSVGVPRPAGGGSPPFQSAAAATKAAVKRESRRSPTMETSNSDLFASIGISAAPKFQPPVSKPATGSSRTPLPFAATPEPAHRVSKVLLKDHVDAGQWGDEDELDGLSDTD